LVSEIASVYKAQVKTKAKTSLSFTTRHEDVWASGSKHPQTLVLSTSHPRTGHWIQGRSGRYGEN